MGFGGQKRAVRCVAHRGANASSGNIILGNIVGNAIKQTGAVPVCAWRSERDRATGQPCRRDKCAIASAFWATPQSSYSVSRDLRFGGF
jgi:hypothetical protein